VILSLAEKLWFGHIHFCGEKPVQEGKRLRTTILALAWTALTAVFALGTPATAAAQGTATIRGTVTDASGGVLPGATVTITNSNTKDVRTAVTDDRGGYAFASLFNGTYEVKVEDGEVKVGLD